MRLLLKHADLLTFVDGEWITVKNGYLGIDGDTICYLSGERPAEDYDEEKDLYGKLVHRQKVVLPGP